jgi:hypothetical protein
MSALFRRDPINVILVTSNGDDIRKQWVDIPDVKTFGDLTSKLGKELGWTDIRYYSSHDKEFPGNKPSVNSPIELLGGWVRLTCTTN